MTSSISLAYKSLDAVDRRNSNPKGIILISAFRIVLNLCCGNDFYNSNVVN